MQTKKLLLLFLIALLTVSLLVSIVYAPSTIVSSDDEYAISYPFQRKTFYANGRFWAFYSDNTDMAYSTSTNGISWTGKTTIRACTDGRYFSVWFDGTYFHYAYASNSYIYYRRGYPNSNGSISWSTTAEQTISTTYNHAYYPFVSVDSSGYVWIGYLDAGYYSYYPFVIKSQYNNGSWGTTPSGFPYQLSTLSYTWAVSIIPLTNNKMLAVYAYTGSTVRARRWDGSSWGSERATTSTIRYCFYYSAVAYVDDVHLAFLSSGYNILHAKYVYASDAWSSEATIQANVTSSTSPVLSIDYNGKPYCFWATKTTGSPPGAIANHIYYQTSTDGGSTWSAMVDWIDASSDILYSADRLSCFYRQYGDYIALLFMTTSTGNEIRFGCLTVTAVPEERSFSFTEIISLVTTFAQWQERIYIFQEVIKPSASVTTNIPVVAPPSINYFALFAAVLTLFVLMLILEGGNESRHSITHKP